MKQYIFILFSTILLISCSEKNKVKEAIQEIPVDIKVDRFDQAFFETPIQDLSNLKQQYPSFFPQNVPDSVWTNKMSNPLWRELYTEVQKKYKNFDKQTSEIEDLFSHIKYYYPQTKTPKVVTLIYDMDPDYKAIYADSLIIVSLELYLGKNHKFYEFPEYQKLSFESSQILPDIVQEFSVRKIKPPTEKDLLSLMIYAGKQLYLKDALLPEYSDEDKIGYTKEQLQWAITNQADVWRFFIEEKLLYETDPKLAQRFIQPAPFTKFGLTSDNESPGRMGSWMGWQIVKSFMKNNTEATLQKMVLMDAKEIFQKSKYKPKK
ncbi:gliding motility lipoprotein GldB [Flavobacterium sp.]|uniref:gliding motility lipoprotein GldB n=1 Tax=Flavobacterium sp. TaxID=239 RepID=UPI00286E5851|nr:gliding motility lipoprotein GldB [Flavobacterium sp.]